jgi:hypothetical protein
MCVKGGCGSDQGWRLLTCRPIRCPQGPGAYSGSDSSVNRRSFNITYGGSMYP